jgi:hypothetical protein
VVKVVKVPRKGCTLSGFEEEEWYSDGGKVEKQRRSRVKERTTGRMLEEGEKETRVE